MISLRSALDGMERLDSRKRAVPFDLVVVTADRKKMTGGELLELKGGVLHGERKSLHQDLRIGRIEGGKPQDLNGGKKIKGPNHWENKTRNVLLPNGEVRKVHIRLIVRFNGQRVL